MSALSVLAARPALPQSSEPLHWQSAGSTASELTREVTALYGKLYEAGVLPTRRVENPTGRPIPRILTEEGLRFDESLPEDLDVLLCRINPEICSVGPRDGSTGRSYTTRWTQKSTDPIVVPNVRFEVFAAPRLYRKSSRDRLSSIVVNDRQGCVKWNDECKASVANLNRADVFAEGYEGWVVVPTRALRATIVPHASPSAADSQAQPDAAEPTPNEQVDLRSGSAWKRENVHGAGPLRRYQEALQAAQRESGRDSEAPVPPGLSDMKPVEITPELRSIIQSPERIELKATLPDPTTCPLHLTAFDDLLRQVEHPGDGGDVSVTLAVIDGAVDDDHCEFRGRPVKYFPPREGPPPECTACAEGAFVRARDHGTHVAGIAGAALHRTGKNANRRTLLLAQTPVPATSRDVTLLVHTTLAEQIDVYSLSLDVPTGTGYADTLKGEICQLHPSKVFVAAAGNSGEDLSGACSVHPACYEFPNVISVIASSQDAANPVPLGSPPNGSNYGANLHIAAPGENILSTIFGNQWGRSSGTSQATPIVAAAAALLISKKERITPAEIKERLIATSDLFDTLRGKVVGGRLNIRRALALENDQIVYQDEQAVTRSVEGRTSYEQLYYRSFDDGALKKSIPWSRVLRLHRDPGASTHTIFLRSERGTGVPDRIDHVRILPRDPTEHSLGVMENGSLVEIQPTQIIDYTAAYRRDPTEWGDSHQCPPPPSLLP